jgi:hypothetical protein
VTEIARRINPWDLAIIFFPPIRTNLKHTLPNKFFEAVQGRLGIVSGESPEMARLIREGGFGTVVQGWTAADLAAAINGLTTEDVTRMKAASDQAARELNSENERAVFLRLLTAS